MISKKEFEKFKKNNKSMKDFIEPTKILSTEFKRLSTKIEDELTKMELENKAFWDSYIEIVGFHKSGLSMEQIKENYRQEQIRKEQEFEKNDVLEMFKNKLQSLKASLSVNGEF